MNAQRSRRSFCAKRASKYEDGRTGAAYRPIRSYSNKLALRVEDRRARDHRAPNHISKTVLSTVHIGGPGQALPPPAPHDLGMSSETAV